MKRNMRRSARKAGLPPGSLVHTGEPSGEATCLRLLTYDEERCSKRTIRHLPDLDKIDRSEPVAWLSVVGVQDPAVLDRVGTVFGLHPLVLEDIMNIAERPKVEDFGDYIFVLLKLPGYDDERDEITSDQVCLVLGPTWVVSFQEHEEAAIESIRERIQAGTGRFHQMGADYLAYALIDILVDQYFVVLEQIEDDTERYEDLVVEEPSPEVLQGIHKLKSAMIALRKSVWPVRDVLGFLERGETPLVQEKTQIYLRDVYDHTIQIIDTIETFRDIQSGLIDIYLSNVSNRLNEVMKVLTIIATVFMPLSFLAGVYGMNFKVLPELGWQYGYAMFWGVVVLSTALMLRFFRRKQWI